MDTVPGGHSGLLGGQRKTVAARIASEALTHRAAGLRSFTDSPLGEMIARAIGQAQPRKREIHHEIVSQCSRLHRPSSRRVVGCTSNHLHRDYDFWGHGGWYNTVAGSITTDGNLGVLLPEAIVGWNICVTYSNYVPFPVIGTVDVSSTAGGVLTFTPGSFSAVGNDLVFDFGPSFTR